MITNSARGVSARHIRIELLLIVLPLLLALACACACASNCIGEVKTQGLTSPVTLTDRVVTGVYPNFFYIQDTESGHHSCGIMVKSSVVPTVTDTVTVIGTLAQDPDTDELCINASSVDITDSAALPKALGRNNRDVGGGSQGSATGPADGGMNTIGVLQTTWGKASSVVKGQSLIVDDGSRCPVKVVGPVYSINNNDYVRVVGVAGVEKNGTAHTRVIRIRDWNDAIALGTTPPALTDPLIDLDPADLAAGDLACWPNKGTLGGIFGADGTTPNVGVVAGKKCVTFADTDRMKASFLAPSGITGSGDYSVVFWAYKTSLVPEMPVLSWAARNGSAGACAGFNFGNLVNTGAATHGTDPFDLAFGFPKPSANMWRQIAITYDGVTEKCYLDGTLSATEAKTLAIASGERVYVGCGYSLNDGVYSPDVFLPASVASVRVYDYLLSDTQINQMYTAVVTTHTISGQVKNKSTGIVMSGARVYVSDTVPASANPAFYKTTDSSGNYTVTVAAGVWHVMVIAPAFLAAPDTVVDVTSSNVTGLNYQLTFTPTTEVVNVDAAYMAQGPLTSCANLGAQPGSFTTDGTTPVVETIEGVPCITFDGTNHLRSDFVLPVHMTSLMDWSICAWVYNPSIDPVECMFSWAKDGGAAGSVAQINYGSSATSGAVYHGGALNLGFGSGLPPAGAWRHIAVTFGSTSEKVYVDGALVSSGTRALNVGFGCPAFVGCGYLYDGSNYTTESNFTGSIARLTAYDRVLDAATIHTLALADLRTVKIMPLGDSITDGYNVAGGYRIKLWADIQGIGKHIDFVGSQSNGPPALGDHDHEGHPGWQCTDLIANIDTWMDSAKPKIVLVHICTNDIAGGASADTCISRLSTLIDKIWAKLPIAGKIYVAQVTPRTDNAALNDRTKEFNSKVPDLVAQKVVAGKNVHVVNMYGDPVTNPSGVMTTDLADGLHPNQAGYDKMGDLWFNAIQGDLVW